MSNMTRYIAVVIAGLLMATSSSLAASKRSARDAAIRKCNAVVLKQVPNVGDSASNQQQRAALWKDCMVSAGQRP